MFLEREGVSLFYEVSGAGEPIVLLHGNGEDHTYFDQQLPFLIEQGFQVITIDMRGHGASSLGEEALSFDVFAQDVLAVCDACALSSFHILGFSDGANTAMTAGLLYPERIRSLILNSGNIHPKGLCSRVRHDIYKAYARARVQAVLAPSYQREVQLLQLMVKHPHMTSKQLQTLPMPVLVIAGTQDMVEASHTRAIAHSIPHVRLILLPQGDHFIAQNRSEEFNQMIGTFLQEVRNGR